MPRPFDSIKWGLQSVGDALNQAEGQGRIPQQAKDIIKGFTSDFTVGRNHMKEAMATEIRWMNDGRTFPWSVEQPSTPKYDRTERAHLRLASTIQSDYRAFAEALSAAGRNQNHSYEETARLKDMLIGLQASVETLIDGVDNIRESKNNNKPAYEIFNNIKNQVNDVSNDTRFGPFGMLVKFGKDEAQSFVDFLNFQVTDFAKKQEVIEMLFDTASSPYGNLVLNQAAADVISGQWGHLGLDWSKAVDAFKEEHPIVALYAVRIDSEIASGSGTVREMEALLRTATAARAELSNEFVTRGPVALGGASLANAPESASLTGRANRGERAQRVQDLDGAIVRLQAHIEAMKAQA
jgi:hypothetical protein